MAFTTIDDPSVYFQTLLYTGNGSSSRALTNTGNSDLQPDWLWIKNRGNATTHGIWDSSRGAGKRLTISADAEEDQSNLASFNSDGFTVNTGDIVNTNTHTYVAWQWKANGGTTTTNDASSTGVGGLDSVYQANTTAGFSIVTYTGSGSNTTVAHGLGNIPEVIIFKKRTDDTEDWLLYHHTQGNAAAGKLNTNAAFETGSGSLFDSTTPTSTVFSIKTNSKVNDSSDTYVAYCFSEVQGYSKFGSYKGNGDADGPFNYLGFLPKFLIVRRVDSGNHWLLMDAARADVANENPVDQWLRADTNDAESSGLSFDFLSNGFKCRSNDPSLNADGGTYIYMAFAEHPFVSSEGVPVTAR